MRKFYMPLLFIFATFFAISQEKNELTYKIISVPADIDQTAYITAMDKANFECFRFESKSRVLTFKSGVVIELLSHDKVVESGVIQNNCFLPNNTEAIEYQLELVGESIAIKAPYDKNLKRVNNEK